MFREIKTEIDRLRSKYREISGSGDAAENNRLLSLFTQIAAKVTDSERCSVFIHDPANNKVWLKTGTEVKEHGIEVPVEGSVVGKVISSGKAIMIADVDEKSIASKMTDEKTGFATRNMLCVPIRSPHRAEITGAFELLNKKGEAGYTEEDKEIALEIAEHLQAHVDAIFLGQEVFGLTEQLYLSAIKVTRILVGSVTVLLLILFLVIVVYALIPEFM